MLVCGVDDDGDEGNGYVCSGDDRDDGDYDEDEGDGGDDDDDDENALTDDADCDAHHAKQYDGLEAETATT